MENKKKKKKKIEECNCDNECHCQEGDECICGDECNCDSECQCQAGKECTCGDECTCGEECTCHEQDESELLAKRIKDLEEAFLRSNAELLNYKKRKDEEVNRIIKYAEEDILREFLPILDNFERAIGMDDNNKNDEVSKYLEGFKLMYNQIKALLDKFEVKEIDALDKEFDPALHQAVTTGKDESKSSGTVLKVLQKGYMYKDRVLRTAMVMVNE